MYFIGMILNQHRTLYSCFIELILCEHPIEIMGGVFQTASNELGSVADFTCQIPYVLTGSDRYICRRSGTWVGNLGCGKCKLVH